MAAKVKTKRLTFEHHVWTVTYGDTLVFSSEHGAREACDVIYDSIAVKVVPRKVRYFYDSATTADIQDILQLPTQNTLELP